jgi:TonB family protein
MMAARAIGANPSVLPPDAELRKWIVGSWKAEFQTADSAPHYMYETYADDGTFKVFESVKEGRAPEKVFAKLTGTWNVEGGFLVTKVTASNVSAETGHGARLKIEFANRESFVVRGRSGPHTLRRARLPADFVSARREVPKLFSVQEAAQVLRYAVKPQYSLEALRTRATGTGVFELRFDYESGRLKAIDIVQSTGSRLLDHDAINGLKEWRAKPHSVRIMRIPVAFTFSMR